MATLRCPDLHIAETLRISVFQSPYSHTIKFHFKVVLKHRIKTSSILKGQNTFSNLVIPLILNDIQFVPSFLIQVYIFPFVACSPYLSSNLNKSSFVGKDCWYSIADGTAVVVGSGDTEQLRPLVLAEIPPVEGVDVDTKAQPVGWAPGWETGNQVVVDNGGPN